MRRTVAHAARPNPGRDEDLASHQLARGAQQRRAATSIDDPAIATSIATVKKPVGCSISSWRIEPAAETTPTCAATEPGSAQAVATLTAPSTPIGRGPGAG